MWLWIAGFIKPYAGALVLVMVLSLIAVGGGLAQPYLTKSLIDDGILRSDSSFIWTLVAIGAAIAVCSTVLNFLVRRTYVSLSCTVLHAMREDIFKHILSLSPTYFSGSKQGDIQSRLDGDIAEIQRFAVDTLLASVNNIIMLVGSLVLIWTLSPPLVIVTAGVIIISTLFVRCLRPTLETMSRRARLHSSAIMGFFVEKLRCVKFIQAHCAEMREIHRLSDLHIAMRGDALRLQFVAYAAHAVPTLITSLTILGVFGFGSGYIASGEITLGALIAFVSYLQKSISPAQNLLGSYVSLQKARVSMERVKALMDERPAVASPSEPILLPCPANGILEFRDVSFIYPGSHAHVLKTASAVIPSGSHVLLSGKSGAGKTTITDLLQRYYDPSEGQILLGGANIADFNIADLRRVIYVVSQEATVVHGTLADNIRYGSPTASDKEVHNAAELAGLLVNSPRFVDGIRTIVGERGADLSGGERQRISLARALLMKPEILVIDEGTSAVDVLTENALFSTIRNGFSNKTVIYVSHRPGDMHYDVCIELVRGQLIQARSVP
ncbi:ABC transporter ATP-binding protein [Noviherbaspirillum sp. CPCC 100848]|uniref:ABC transporter ATP-binding protein n=1 Tax=Noviherbaspirillum album TaxID=3080276 RepID=A0ABU6JH60_9BURK|nr:ABC transporter ATP-binding protein [Noviherbaspirillum sp. CPCC 100848]MEC4722811.1 ABC transporter ATP-binding protein [Noviherbaspirillum sp. CPCC 100848]